MHSLKAETPRTEDSFLQVILQAQPLHPKKNEGFEHLPLDGGLLTKPAVNQELQQRKNEAARKKYKLRLQSPMIQHDPNSISNIAEANITIAKFLFGRKTHFSSIQEQP